MRGKGTGNGSPTGGAMRTSCKGSPRDAKGGGGESDPTLAAMLAALSASGGVKWPSSEPGGSTTPSCNHEPKEGQESFTGPRTSDRQGGMSRETRCRLPCPPPSVAQPPPPPDSSRADPSDHVGSPPQDSQKRSGATRNNDQTQTEGGAADGCGHMAADRGPIRTAALSQRSPHRPANRRRSPTSRLRTTPSPRTRFVGGGCLASYLEMRGGEASRDR